jgi:hypothetical protein
MCGSAGCSLLRAEGFSCSLDVLYGGLWILISKFQFFIFKNIKFFFQLYILIRIGTYSAMMREPDPKYCFSLIVYLGTGTYIFLRVP